eukprot:299903-Amphidinium_carterae.2
MAAVSQNGQALAHASAKMKADRRMVLAAVASDGSALPYASEGFRESEVTGKRKAAPFKMQARQLDFLINLLAVCCIVIRDREIVLRAVSRSGSALRYASEELQCDREVALTAISQTRLALPYVSVVFLEEESFAEEARRVFYLFKIFLLSGRSCVVALHSTVFQACAPSDISSRVTKWESSIEQTATWMSPALGSVPLQQGQEVHKTM